MTLWKNSVRTSTENSLRSERDQVESLLNSDPQAKTAMDELMFIQEMGPVVEESMPGDAYWQDLPDRIIERVNGESLARPVIEAPKPTIWERLFSPQAAWKWAAATAVVAIAGFGINSQSPTGPQADNLQANSLTVNDQATNEDLLAEAHNQNDAYVQRVAKTFGGPMGVSLDQTSSGVVRREPGPGSLIQQASGFGHLEVPASQEPQQLQSQNGCTVEESFKAARYCEETGSPRLAMEGYRLVAASTDQRADLNLAARLGLVRSEWTARLQETDDLDDTFQKLMMETDAAYNMHASGVHSACEDAWAVHYTLVSLSASYLDAAKHAEYQDQMTDVARCVK